MGAALWGLLCGVHLSFSQTRAPSPPPALLSLANNPFADHPFTDHPFTDNPFAGHALSSASRAIAASGPWAGSARRDGTAAPTLEPQRLPAPSPSELAPRSAFKTPAHVQETRARAQAGALQATRPVSDLVGVGDIGAVGAEAAVNSLEHHVLVEHRIHQGDLLHLALETLATSVGWTFLWYPGVSWRAIANIDLTPYGDPTQAVIALVKVMRQEGKAIQLRLSASNRVMEVLSTEVSHD